MKWFLSEWAVLHLSTSFSPSTEAADVGHVLSNVYLTSKAIHLCGQSQGIDACYFITEHRAKAAFERLEP